MSKFLQVRLKNCLECSFILTVAFCGWSHFCPFLSQSGAYDLVGTILYEIDQHPYQTIFYNGTIEVTEPGGMFSVESVFLFCLGVTLLILLGVWIRSQVQHLSKVKMVVFCLNVFLIMFRKHLKCKCSIEWSMNDKI